MNPPERIDAYLRVSSMGERAGQESYRSPDDQRAAIQRWAEYKGVDIVAEHLDEDESGGTQERPGLERAIARALSGETDGIVCFDISRFSRYTEGGLRDLRRLEEADARLVFATEEIDTSTPHGKLIYTILLATHAAALDQHKSRWKVTKARAIDEGRQIGPTPFGYTRERGAHGRLTPHEVEGPAITEAYRLAASEGLRAAAAHLQAAIPTTTFVARKRPTAERYGVNLGEPVTVDATWNTATLRRLLARKVYLGTATYGDYTNEQAHDPLTDLATWTRAQHHATGDRAPSESFPLTGHAICATCGGTMAGSRSGSEARGNYRRMYKCTAKGCERRASVSAEPLEDWTRKLLTVDVEAREMDPESHPEVVPDVPATLDLAALESALESAKLARHADAVNLDLPADVVNTRMAAHAERIAAAQEAYDVAARESAPTKVVPTSEELAAMPLGDALARLDLAAVVEPGRGQLTQRVVLEPIDPERSA